MKKIFSFILMAVAAIVMVSCDNAANKVANEYQKAAEAKDMAQLVSLGDSISALGDQADAQSMAVGVCSYASAYIYWGATQKDTANTQGIVNAEEYAKDPKKGIAFCDKMIALYDAAKKKDADGTKEIFEAFKAAYTAVGASSMDDFINKVKADITEAKKTLEASAEGEEGEEAAEGEEGSEEPAEGEE